MDVMEKLLELGKGPAKKESAVSQTNWDKILGSANFQKNPPVIKLTYSSEEIVNGKAVTKIITRYAIIFPDKNTIERLRSLKNGVERSSLCVNTYGEINEDFQTPYGGCPLSLKALQEGKVELDTPKITASIKSAGFAQDPEHIHKKWSIPLQ